MISKFQKKPLLINTFSNRAMLASRCRVLAAAASGSFLGMSYTHMDEA
jgi:hypothetical protein